MGNNFFSYLNTTATNTAITYYPVQWSSGSTTAQVVLHGAPPKAAKPKTQREWLAERVEETCSVGREALAA